MLATKTESGPADATLYHQIADKLCVLIKAGTIRPGSRMPSVRKLHKQMNVSITTVLEAYRQLENRGIVEARSRSGFYVRMLRRELPPEPAMTASVNVPRPVRLSEVVAEVFRNGSDPAFMKFGAAIPSTELLPIKQLNRVAAQAARQDPARASSYDIAPGYALLREQIARRMIDAGCVLKPMDIVSTIGTQEAISLCLRALTKPGDCVAIESPTYYGFLQLIESLDLRAIEVASDPRTGICIDELSRAIRKHKAKAALVVSNFSNPLGGSIPEGKKKLLAELACKTGVPIIEDDQYGELSHDGRRPRAIKAFDKDGSVLYCSSASKTLAPGYRVGWCIPGRFYEQVLRIKTFSTLGNPSLPQMAVARFLAGGGYDHHLRRLQRTYGENVERMMHAVAAQFPEGTRMSRPTGGHVLWVELPKKCDAMKLYHDAASRKISIAPGAIFSLTDRFRHCLRLNFSFPWTERVEDSLAKIGELAKRQRS